MYVALGMACPLSVKPLLPKFFSRTSAVTSFAQGLSISVTAFSSFLRKFLGSCSEEGECFQSVGVIGKAGHTFGELLTNLRSFLECIFESQLNLTVHRCEMGLSEAVLGFFDNDPKNVNKQWDSCEFFDQSQNAWKTEANSAMHFLSSSFKPSYHTWVKNWAFSTLYCG